MVNYFLSPFQGFQCFRDSSVFKWVGLVWDPCFYPKNNSCHPICRGTTRGKYRSPKKSVMGSIFERIWPPTWYIFNNSKRLRCLSYWKKCLPAGPIASSQGVWKPRADGWREIRHFTPFKAFGVKKMPGFFSFRVENYIPHAHPFFFTSVVG